MVSTLENIKELHEEFDKSFEGKIHFETAPLLLIHKDDFTVSQLWYDLERYYEMYTKYTVEGYYNIYIIPSDADISQGVLGLTTVPYRGVSLEVIEAVKPYYDNSVVSYQGLLEVYGSKILSHEAGHFLGLSHTFELTLPELHSLGIHSYFDMSRNFMNYSWFIDTFTKEQLSDMVYYLEQYRCYLLK